MVGQAKDGVNWKEKRENPMPNPVATAVHLSAEEQAILEQIIRQPSSAQGLVIRSQIIVGAGQGESISGQAQTLGLRRNRIRHWRRVWEAHHAERMAAEDEKGRRRIIERVLTDAPRSGTPSTFSAEQVVHIIAVSCEDPAQSGYPVSHWTQRQLAREVVKRGIVERISGRQVGRFLKRGGC